MSDARRGEIWSGSYRDGFPFVCVVVSSNLYNDVMHSALIVPFAGKPGDQGNPFTVRHPAHGSLFPDRVMWILSGELRERLGKLPDELMAVVNDRLRFVLGV